MIGTLFEMNDRYGFAFDEKYRRERPAPILSLSLLNRARQPRAPGTTHMRIPPFFANLLPEPNSRLRTYLAAQNRVDPRDDLGLLRVLGVDLPGAVTLESSDSWEEESPTTRPYVTPTRRVLRFSLAGVQMKFSVRKDGTRYVVPTDGIGGTHILKLPDPAKPDLPENEAAMMRFAAACGIETPPIELVPLDAVDGVPDPFGALRGNAYIIERFDRYEGRRIHIEDFAQIFRVYPDEKYERKSFDEMLGLCYRILGEAAAADFVRRLVFSIAVANADMHLKNWSVRYATPAVPMLAPAYDYVCTAAYSGYDDFLALPLANVRHWAAIRDDTFSAAARNARIHRSLVLAAAHDMRDRIADAWPKTRKHVPTMVHRVIERQLATPFFRA